MPCGPVTKERRLLKLQEMFKMYKGEFVNIPALIEEKFSRFYEKDMLQRLAKKESRWNRRCPDISQPYNELRSGGLGRFLY